MKAISTALLLLVLSFTLVSQNVIIVIIDGARYSETFGDPNTIHIPEMAALAQKGALITEFYNDSTTYTSKAIPTIWCGTWTRTIDTVINEASTQYTSSPSLFEYYRKQKSQAEEQCLYILKYVPSLWLPSFHSDYGPNYWPLTISEGGEDADVLNNALTALESHKPQLSVIYFADVDSHGHSGNWTNYTTAIKNADAAVGSIWEYVQASSHYKDNTVMLVTNDHGRHDNDHGGFKGHGCGCDGCRHIMLLAIGEGIKENYQSNTYRRLPDVAVTAASILGVNPEYSTGEVMQEIFASNAINNTLTKKDWTIIKNEIHFNHEYTDNLSITISNLKGQSVFFKRLNEITDGHIESFANERLHKGIYIISIQGQDFISSKKILIN